MRMLNKLFPPARSRSVDEARARQSAARTAAQGHPAKGLMERMAVKLKLYWLARAKPKPFSPCVSAHPAYRHEPGFEEKCRCHFLPIEQCTMKGDDTQ